MSSRKTLLSLAALLLSACSAKDSVAPPADSFTVSNDVVAINPGGYAPLTAQIHVETAVASTVSLTVVGRHGTGSDVVKTFVDLGTTHDVPVLGLYPDFDNTVRLTFTDAAGAVLGTKSYTVRPGPLPTGVMPAITIDTKKAGQFASGMTLVSYFGYATTNVPQMPFIFDEFGDVRWYLDFRTNPTLATLFFDDGAERLQNGNLYFGDAKTSAIYEVDMLGRVQNIWSLQGYVFHHNVQEKPNGNFLITVTKAGLATTDDFIIEIDRATKQIIRTWDLRQSLDPTRRTLFGDASDWIHVNAIVYDPTDSTIIISGRTQGLVKLDATNHVVWILGSHKGWATAGNGTPLTPFLLQPLDAAGQPITDRAVLDGDANHPDFEWNWYQHAPLVMANGDIMLFDNGGTNRNFSGRGQYSRAVQFHIDATAKTVRQVWSYGKERGAETFSAIVSDVDVLSQPNHVIFSPGAVVNGSKYGKVIEMDYATKDVVFEATLTPPQTFFNITFHRTERLSLYP